MARYGAGPISFSLCLSLCLSHHHYVSQLFLNDWSFASKVDDKVLFRGNQVFAPDAILERRQRNRKSGYKPRPSHDLETLVKLVYCVRHTQDWPPGDTPADLL